MTRVRAVEPADRDALVALFSACDAPCACRYWHFEGDKNEWLARCFGDPAANVAELDEALAARRDDALGVVALDGDALVGWCKVCPAPAVPKAYGQRFYKGLACFTGDRARTFLVGCVLVHPAHRGRRVSDALVAGATRLAAERGAVAVEAFPRRTPGRVADGELWMGPPSCFERASFVAVGGEDPYPVLRRVIAPPAVGAAPEGVLLIDKPRGPTGHDVVARLRRALRTKRIGHAGTLDPMATGLLVVLVGEATKLEPYLSATSKRYDATLAFGRATDTLDAMGETVREGPLPPELLAALDGDPTSFAPLRAALDAERARTEQIPPAFSAIHVDGVRSYERARAGRPVELPPRSVHLLDLAVAASAAAPPRLTLRLTSSKGYYVRSLARDLGDALGVPAHLAELRRTGAGAFSLEEAISLDAPREALLGRLVPIVEAARRALPVVALVGEGPQRARVGKTLRAEDAEGPLPTGPAAWLDGDRLVAIGEGERVLRGFGPGPVAAGGERR